MKTLKVDSKVVHKVKRQLTKLCDGDITQMQRVLDVVCGENSGSYYEFYLAYLSKPMAHYEFENPYDLAIQACNQIRTRKLTVTTEKPSPQPKTDTTENDSTQLTLDFSAITEQSPLGLLRETTPGEIEFSVVSPDSKWLQIEQEILQRFGGDQEKKGWFAPQYKYVDECGNSRTTTDPSHVPAVKIYGPYWTYRWFQPGKNDGNLYLGAASSNKFLRFALVWENSKDTTEILDKWFGWLGKD